MTAARTLPVEDAPAAAPVARRRPPAPRRSSSARRPVRPARVSPASRRRSSQTAPRSAARRLPGARLRQFTADATPLQRAGMAFGAGAFVVLLGLVGISGQRVEAQSRLDELQRQLAVVHNANRELRAEVAEAESPAVVLDAAARQGLVEPGPIVPLESGPVVPAPATSSTEGRG